MSRASHDLDPVAAAKPAFEDGLGPVKRAGLPDQQDRG